MQRIKARSVSRSSILIVGMVVALGMAWSVIGTAQDKYDSAKDPNQHSQHKHKSQATDQDLASQILELQAKVARLEAALNRDHKDPLSGTSDTEGVSDSQDKSGSDSSNNRVSSKFQNCLQCHRTRPNGQLPVSHLEPAGGSDKGTKSGGMSRMGASKKPASGKSMGMMGGKGMDMMDMDEMKDMGAMEGGTSPSGGEMKMMDKMMGMMEKMMSGGSMQPSRGMSGGMGSRSGGTPSQSVETKMMEKMDRMMGLMEKMTSRGSMQSNQSGMGAMSGDAAPQSVETKMMEKMDRMMDLMEKMASRGSMQSGQGMSSMGGGAPPISSEVKMMERMMDLMEKMMEGGSMKSGQGMPAGGGGMQDM